MERTISNLSIFVTAVRRMTYRIPEILCSYALSLIVGFLAFGFLALNVGVIVVMLGLLDVEGVSIPSAGPDFSTFVKHLFYDSQGSIVIPAVIFVCGLLIIFSVMSAWRLIVNNAVAKHEHIFSWSNARDSFRIFPQILAIDVISSITIGVGWICFVVPGFIILASWALSAYVVVNEKCGPVEAISRSYRLMQGYRVRYVIIFSLMLSVWFLCRYIGNPYLTYVCFTVAQNIFSVITALYYHRLSEPSERDTVSNS